jgi:hypothetical protein
MHYAQILLGSKHVFILSNFDSISDSSGGQGNSRIEIVPVVLRNIVDNLQAVVQHSIYNFDTEPEIEI